MAAPKTEPRKRPRQARSRVLYDALVEATQRVLASEGVAAVTTARVAEVAGVSIGSLYQYFPSCEALIAAVIDHKIESDVRELMPFIESLRTRASTSRSEGWSSWRFDIIATRRRCIAR